MGSLSPKCDTRLQHWHVDVEKITISLKSIHPKSRCPLCHRYSRRVHSSYTRKLNDLPRSGRPVLIYLTVRRFFCVNPLCKRSIYTERISNFIQPWARKTNRLLEALKHVALSSGGEAGARLSQKLGIGTSADTLLRLARIELSKNISDIRFVGVDDWAYKKGHRYGTIICDLESRKPIDLLPDRSSKSLANWLKQFPTITIVTRDRSGVYADGIKRGAPQAIQVADRWHLLKNLGDALENYLHKVRLPQLCQSQSVIPTVHRKQNTLSKQTRNEIQQKERRNRKWKRILEVQSLYQDGVPIREIARRLKISRQSIRKYIKLESMPEKVKSKRKSLLDPYKPFILHRLQQGCSNAMQLFREIRDQGYPGGHSIVRMFVADHRHLIQECASKPVTQMKYQKISPRTARGVIWKKESDLSEREKEILKLILESDENIRTIHKLVQSFRDIMDSRQAKQLEDWIKEAEICGIQELKGFVLGIRRDFDAVYASLSLEWSNGLVEGHIHRLKLIKRQMYGRANFDLLRNRVLYQE